MISILLGTLLLLSPFLLIFQFKDKILGFVKILFWIITSQLLMALITQALGVFTYPIILILNLIATLVIVLIFISKTNWSQFWSQFKFKKVDWILILILIIIFINLYSVHYNYSGFYNLAMTARLQSAEHLQYPYPYYADEWYAVSFISASISSHHLPLNNPLDFYFHASAPGTLPFINFELASHSFLAEILLLLGLNPLTSYSILSIFISLIICLLIYLWLKSSTVPRLAAGLIALSALYLTNGSNLPGLLYLTPLILGLVCLLITLFFLRTHSKKLALFASLITLLFYPPLLPFCALGLITYFLTLKNSPIKIKIKNTLIYLIIILLAVLLISSIYLISSGSFNNFFSHVSSKIFYPTFTPDILTHYTLWYVIPWPILILFFPGLFFLIKKKKYWLVSLPVLGLIYWLIYSFSSYRLIIEYQRVVVTTSILITLIAGFGLSYLIKILTNKFPFLSHTKILNYVLIAILIGFILVIPKYTSRTAWQKLTSTNLTTKQIYSPSAPANQYLQAEDLKILNWLEDRTVFLSLPWKNTVLSIALGGYPLTTKPGTISLGAGLYDEFMSASCADKIKFAQTHCYLYYTPPFQCPGFKLLNQSSEGLYLYLFEYWKIK